MSHSPHLKTVLMSGEVVAGAMVFEFFTPGISRILANAGARFAIYDMEHTGMGFETLKWLFATSGGLNMAPMVRVPTGGLHLDGPSAGLGRARCDGADGGDCFAGRGLGAGMPLPTCWQARRCIWLCPMRLPRGERGRENA